MPDFPFQHTEVQLEDAIYRAKMRFDRKHFGSAHPRDKYQLLNEWYLLQERIQPLVDELNDIADWRRRTHGREGDSRPVALHS